MQAKMLQMRIMLNNLESCLQGGIKEGLDYAKKLLVESSNAKTFEEWVEQESSEYTEFSCQVSWDTPRLVVICNTCAIGKNSGICIPCFLNGKHDGHDLRLEVSDSGVCDCGNTTAWQREGYCKYHSVMPIDGHLQGNLASNIEFYSRIFELILRQILLHAHEEENDVHLIADFLIDIVSIADAYRRMMAIVLAEQYDMSALFIHWPRFTIEASSAVYRFLVEMMIDELFTCSFTALYFDNIQYWLPIEFHNLISDDNHQEMTIQTPIAPLLDLGYYAWNFLIGQPQMIAEWNIPNVLAKQLLLITTHLAFDDMHPLYTQLHRFLFLENWGVIMNNKTLLMDFSYSSNSEALNTLLFSLGQIEGKPFLSNKISFKNDFSFYNGGNLFYRSIVEIFNDLIYIDVDSKVFENALADFIDVNIDKDLTDTTDPSIPFNERPVFYDGVSVSLFLPIHNVYFLHRCIHSKEPFEFNEKLLIYPFRLTALRSLLQTKVASAKLLEILCQTSLAQKESDASKLGRMAALACGIAFHPDINYVLKTFLSIFWIPNNYNMPIINVQHNLPLLYFCPLYLISCVISDPLIFDMSSRSILKERIVAMLSKGATNAQDFIEDFGEIEDQNQFLEIFYEVGEKDFTDYEVNYVLGAGYHSLSPSYLKNAEDIFERWKDSDFVRNGNSLIQFPLGSTEIPSHFNVNRVLFSTYFYAFCYIILLEFKENTSSTAPTVQLVFNLFIYAASLEKNKEDPIGKITATSMSDLASKLPENLYSFLDTHILYYSHVSYSFMDLAKCYGQVGQAFIQAIKSPSTFSFKTNNKSLRNHIELDYMYRRKKSLPLMVDYDHPICASCKKEIKNLESITLTVYPSKIFGNRKSYLFVAGKDVWHTQCHATQETVLPLTGEKIDMLCEEFPSLEILIQSLADMISIVEIRGRTNPFVYTDGRTLYQNRHMFRVAKIWSKKFKLINDVNGDPIALLISRLLRNKSPLQNFFDLVKMIWMKEISNNFYTFLRRALLVGIYIIGVKLTLPESFYQVDGGFMDVIKLLRLKVLDREPEFLKPFLFCNLPHNFLEFTAEPYDVDVYDSKEIFVLDIFTNQVINKNDIDSHVLKVHDNCGMIYIILSGPEATLVIFTHPLMKKKFVLNNIYVDIFGNGDGGLKNGQMLYLSEDRLFKLADSYLSGDILNYSTSNYDG